MLARMDAHVLFHKEHVVANQCLVCGQLWYVLGRSKVPKKMIRHFPFIPRLRWMFRTPNLSRLMTWYHEKKSKDGLVWHAPNSKTWAHIDTKWPNFVKDPRNLRLRLALDGVNPFGTQSTTWSTWPVIILNYNLPPWLTTKKLFLMMVLLILGKEYVKSKNIDVYMAPLIEES